VELQNQRQRHDERNPAKSKQTDGPLFIDELLAFEQMLARHSAPFSCTDVAVRQSVTFPESRWLSAHTFSSSLQFHRSQKRRTNSGIQDMYFAHPDEIIADLLEIEIDGGEAQPLRTWSRVLIVLPTF
jgi:hypothetical protein